MKSEFRKVYGLGSHNRGVASNVPRDMAAAMNIKPGDTIKWTAMMNDKGKVLFLVVESIAIDGMLLMPDNQMELFDQFLKSRNGTKSKKQKAR